MPEKSKNTLSSSSKKSIREGNFERRKHILTVVMMVVGFLVMLSIFSYSKADEAVLEKLSFTDIFRLPFSDQVKTQAALLHNRLGLIGALASDFFINFTLGYSALVFPLLMLMWGWVVLRGKELNKTITFTNYAIVWLCLFQRHSAFLILSLMVSTRNGPASWAHLQRMY